MEEEIWKDVVGFEELYQVSSLGRIKSFKKKNEKILKPYLDKNGYTNIGFCRKTRSKRYLLHRIVAIAFIPNPDNLPQVNHKDGNKQNNAKNNLEWSTPSENTQHSYDTGLKPKGSKHHNAKLTENQVLEIRESKSLHRDLAEKYKVSSGLISNIKNRKKWIYL